MSFNTRESIASIEINVLFSGTFIKKQLYDGSKTYRRLSGEVIKIGMELLNKVLILNENSGLLGLH